MKRNPIEMLCCVLAMLLAGCVTPAGMVEAPTPTAVPATSAPAPPAEPVTGLADVVSVEVTGESGAYSFRVAVLSPDTGCDQYADWWEVVSEEGALLYRRVLLHSHVGEQPFARTGSPVPVAADAVVYVRAHLHPAGYGGQAFKGSAQDGFEPVELGAEFAAGLADEEPLPQGCTH
jgi:hypothetical protein